MRPNGPEINSNAPGLQVNCTGNMAGGYRRVYTEFLPLVTASSFAEVITYVSRDLLR